MYVVNEPTDQEDGSPENGGPNHEFLNKMSDDTENVIGDDTLNDTVGVPMEASTPAKAKKKRQRIFIPSVYR